MAKLFCTDTAMRVTTDAVQILGAVGYTDRYPVERYMREAKVLQIFEGTNQIQRLVISRLPGRAAPGRRRGREPLSRGAAPGGAAPRSVTSGRCPGRTSGCRCHRTSPRSSRRRGCWP